MNKFLQNLNQRPRPATEPTPSPAPPAPVRPSAGGSTEYDPIRRLTDELSRHSGAIEGLIVRIERMEQRPQAATEENVNKLLLEARQGVSYELDAQAVANLVLPTLTNGMPNPANIKAAADAGAQTITEAGQRAATQIVQASSTAANEIKWATRQKADAWANRIGFTTWKAALLIGLIPLLSGAGLIYLRLENDRQQTELAGWKSFGLWVSEKYPEVRKVYDRSDP